jgi:hypothetical protein
MKVKRDIKLIINKLIGTKFEDILNSDLSLELMYVWSVLFNNGLQPSWCARCMRNYYNEIQKKGLQMVDYYEEVQARTCVPKWNGLKYIHRAGRHYNNAYITDKQAIELLNLGFLSESDFEVLPDGYNKAVEVGCIPIFEEKKEKKSKKIKK